MYFVTLTSQAHVEAIKLVCFSKVAGSNKAAFKLKNLDYIIRNITFELKNTKP